MSRIDSICELEGLMDYTHEFHTWLRLTRKERPCCNISNSVKDGDECLDNHPGYSSVGRASDCRSCRHQMVPGSIPGGRICFDVVFKSHASVHAWIARTVVARISSPLLGARIACGCEGIRSHAGRRPNDLTLAGLEPAIFGSEEQRLIH